jgi:hypothetical protein
MSLAIRSLKEKIPNQEMVPAFSVPNANHKLREACEIWNLQQHVQPIGKQAMTIRYHWKSLTDDHINLSATN